MANLKEVRTRIESVNSTKQITSAMKMVAASKLRKSQNAILALRPYADKFSEIMRNITNSVDNNDMSSVYAEQRPVERVLIIPISSNKGLCGVFNANVIRSTINLINNEEYKDFIERKNLDILCIGSKVEDTLKFKKIAVIGNENTLLDNLTYEKAALFAEQLMQMFVERKYDKIVFVYNQFKNAATQILVTEQFLPIKTVAGTGTESSMGKDVEYIFQPNKEDIYGEMVPKSLKIQVYKILLDSFTSEQGARMLSMTQATDNATELLKELNLTYNKARQSAITNELVEIVSGADALKH